MARVPQGQRDAARHIGESVITWNVTHAGHVIGTVEGRSYPDALYEARLAYGPNVRLSAHPRPTERTA